MHKLISIESRKTLIQFFKSSIVSFFNNLFGYFVFIIITNFGFEPKLVMTILYLISTLLSFFWLRKWVFTNINGLTVVNQVCRFYFVYLIGYLINLGLLVCFTDKAGYPYQYVQAAAVIVIAIFFFIMFKTFVFPSSEIPVHER